jgi:hypothetical protein
MLIDDSTVIDFPAIYFTAESRHRRAYSLSFLHVDFENLPLILAQLK